jgi:hypothetical protein
MAMTYLELSNRLFRIRHLVVLKDLLETIITERELSQFDKRLSILTCLENQWSIRATSSFLRIRYPTVLKWADRWKYSRSHDYVMFGYEGACAADSPEDRFIDD